ncbi:pyridoxamine 5'-phosphate oxidase [Maritimibacter sp. 55A14]|uniref:pyridoxamine 5'-phosphate oxidase family protein n=1 Tax=Maritimibacter sp. 55A14 TaxID=2174844 RepID=UPI000D60AF22|nr:pyridoxamine 5'-phosphate oxidase family protein [Maritimibacter sp. 55A14]PWE29883.1 pyridoxamine 5'-phosphate oxidase [Maritimibacter sp. 55A14]
MNHSTPFHAGEIAVQDRAGVPQRAREMATRAIRDAMPAQHQAFFETLPLMFIALLDRRGRPWAVPVSGAPGYARALSPRQLSLSRLPALAEEFELDTDPGAGIGLLGIDLATRRRNRLNGQIASGVDGLVIAVEQSFGNCPKYIQTRIYESSRNDPPSPVRRQAQLKSEAVREIIAGADTFFIASRGANPAGSANEGLDVSHRGGRPGFLGNNENGTLSFPDYSGNRYFNTLGNIEADGRVGLFVPDFTTGAAALVTGRATIDWMSDRIGAFAGAERFVDITCDEVWHVAGALPSTALPVEFSSPLDRTEA